MVAQGPLLVATGKAIAPSSLKFQNNSLFSGGGGESDLEPVVVLGSRSPNPTILAELLRVILRAFGFLLVFQQLLLGTIHDQIKRSLPPIYLLFQILVILLSFSRKK